MNEFESVADITDRWPGLINHDIEQVADLIEYALRDDCDAVSTALEGAEGSTAELLSEIVDSASWSLSHVSDRSREDVLREAARAVFRHEQHSAIESIQSGNNELAEAAVRTLFDKWPVQLEVAYSPSPLFPDGRAEYIPLDLSGRQKPYVPSRTKYVVDCYGQKEQLNRELVEHVERPRIEPDEVQIAEIQALAESVLSFDEKYLDQLRHTYGTKAAGLFMLANAIEEFRAAADEDLDVATFTVPKFTAATVHLHRMYLESDDRYEAYLEEVREQAIGVTNDRYDPELFRPLVAIRSSAVSSEDGENASGAGIYSSVAADPRDPVAFRAAIESVYESMNSEEARAYLAEKGIESEVMGLVIQQYIEDTREYKDSCVYGYVQSSDPYERFITLSSDAGELLFDRSTVESRFMFAPPYGRSQPTFHYNPDHDTLISDFSMQGAQVANAALFAEKLFGKQVELEFAFDSSNTAYVVQVRPLPHQEKPPTIEFPTNIEPLVECRAIGVGDVIVTVRDDDEYDGDELKFDYVDNENQTGRSVHSRDKKAVFVIGYNEANSGHIQMLARERGQICLYPAALTALPSSVAREVTSDYQLSRVRKFRVVADGYRGAIYPIDEERDELLQNLATGISRFVATRNTQQ